MCPARRVSPGRTSRGGIPVFGGPQQVAFDKVDVGLNAAKTMVEGVEERAVVLVVVVGMGVRQRDGLRRDRMGQQRGGEQESDRHSVSKHGSDVDRKQIIRSPHILL